MMAILVIIRTELSSQNFSRTAENELIKYEQKYIWYSEEASPGF